MHKYSLICLCLLLAFLIAADDSPTTHNLKSLSYEVDKVNYTFPLPSKPDKNIWSLKYAIASKIVLALQKHNGIELSYSEKYYTIAKQAQPFSHDIRENMEKQLGFFDSVASAIILKTETDNDDIESLFMKVDKPKDLNKDLWMSLVQKCSIDWARNFLAKTKTDKIDSLLYMTFFQRAYYIVLRDKLIAEEKINSSAGNETPDLETALKRKIESIDFKMPQGYETIRLDVIDHACKLLSPMPDEKIFSAIVAEIKKDNKLQ